MKRVAWMLCVVGLLVGWSAASEATEQEVRLAPAPGTEWMPGERWFVRWERPEKEVRVVVVVRPYIVPTQPYPDTPREIDAQIQRLGALIRAEERAEKQQSAERHGPSGE